MIARQIVSVLKYVHAGKRVFNGIRPENVRIETQEDGKPKAFLIDFSDTSKFVDADSNVHCLNIDTQHDRELLPNDIAFGSL